MLKHPQLITYVDRLAGDLRGLDQILRHELRGVFGGVHLLPFFTPIDGADAGFDPADHTQVDARLGTWADVTRIGGDFGVVADLIVNHVSSASEQFRDWQERGVESPYDGMFLTMDRVFPDGVTDDHIDRIFRPRPGRPFTPYDIAGRQRMVWTTFPDDQVDIDVDHPEGRSYLLSVLDRFAEAGVDLVRLDAVGYAVKRPGTTSFMIPETFAFISQITEECHKRGMEVLVEIRAHHRHQIRIADRVDAVYDFALPALVLHALLTGDAGPLKDWLRMAPRNCVTVLDTHDGIGIIDVAPDGEFAGLLSARQVDELVDLVHAATGGRSREATDAVEPNVDLYQINTTFYEALGSDDPAHFLARLIQLLCPGIPQVYYAGLLAAPNQMDLFRRTQVGRDVNRPYYSRNALAAALQREVVQDLIGLLRWRTSNTELFEGSFEVIDSPANVLALRWSGHGRPLVAGIDVIDKTFTVTCGDTVITTPAAFRSHHSPGRV